MAASYDTVRQILEVIRKHVDKETEEKIVADLLNIKGNKLYRQTIIRLTHKSLQERRSK